MARTRMQLATQALNRYYGYKFDANDPRPGLHVDYDKDDTEVKLDRYTRKVKRVEIERSIIRCVCKHCGSHCLNLLCHLRELPVRSVDGSRVIGVSKNLSEIDVTKGATVRIKRTDRNVRVAFGCGSTSNALSDTSHVQLHRPLRRQQGNPGIEVQYRMECAGCQLPLAYQTKPFTDASNKWIYVLPDAITDTMSEVQTPVFASLVNPHLEQVDANTSSDDSTNQPTASDEGSTTSTLIDSTDASASSTATVPADSSTPTDSLPQVGDKRAREDVNNDDNGTDNQAATDGVSDARSTTAPCSSTESDGSPSTKRPRLSSDE